MSNQRTAIEMKEAFKAALKLWGDIQTAARNGATLESLLADAPQTAFARNLVERAYATAWEVEA